VISLQNSKGGRQIAGRSFQSRNALAYFNKVHGIPLAGSFLYPLGSLHDPIERTIRRRHALPAASPVIALPTMALLTLAESTV
jgi:hypothetical protein